MDQFAQLATCQLPLLPPTHLPHFFLFLAENVAKKVEMSGGNNEQKSPDEQLRSEAHTLVGRALDEAEEEVDRCRAHDAVDGALRRAAGLLEGAIKSENFCRNKADYVVATALKEAKEALEENFREQNLDRLHASRLVRQALQVAESYLRKRILVLQPSDEQCHQEARTMVRRVLLDIQNFIAAIPSNETQVDNSEAVISVPVVPNEPCFRDFCLPSHSTFNTHLRANASTKRGA